MKFGSVCSGIEAASVAWEPLGWEPVFYSEIDKFPSAVLDHHYPSIPNHGDMNEFETWNYERNSIDLLVGGTPCQSFSIAGLRKGLDDDRGNLALTYCRMVDKLRPRWIVWENVPGVLSSNKGQDFGSIVGALVELGYSCSWRVLDAQHFGVPQRRRRLFLVGHSSGQYDYPSKVLFESGCGFGNLKKSRKKKQDITGTVEERVARMRGFRDYEIDGTFSTCKARDYKDATDLVVYESHPIDSRIKELDDVSPTVTVKWAKGAADTPLIAFSSNMSVPDCQEDLSPPLKLGGQSGANPPAICETFAIHDKATRYKGGGDTRQNDGSGNGLGISTEGVSYTLTAGDRHAVCHTHNVRRLTPVECERLQGFPDNYTDIPWRKKDYSPDGPRYKALGNSMAVPVMRWIGNRIQLVDKGEM